MVTWNGSYCVPRGEGGYLTQQPLPMCLSRIAAVVFLYFLCATTSLKCQSQRYWQSSQWERFQTFSFFTFKVKTEMEKNCQGHRGPSNGLNQQCIWEEQASKNLSSGVTLPLLRRSRHATSTPVVQPLLLLKSCNLSSSHATFRRYWNHAIFSTSLCYISLVLGW